MSFYVMVTANFPDTDERDKIYECLKKEKWKKITNVGRDISTVWYGSFNDETSYEQAIETAKKHFVVCSKDYTTPKLAIHAGPDKPTSY